MKQSQQTTEREPQPLTEPDVVNALGGKDVLFVCVYCRDGSIQAYYPCVEGNRIALKERFYPRVEDNRIALKERFSKLVGCNPGIYNVDERECWCDNSSGRCVCHEIA